jgi:hypothetical protein
MEIGQMSAQEVWGGGARQPGGADAVLRHPNGSIDIRAYAVIAHRERAAAIVSSMLSAVRFVRDAGAALAVRQKRSAAGKPCG